MARCGCGGDRCACSVIAGENVVVTGTGSSTSPYVIGAPGPEGCGCAVTAGPGVTVTGDGSDGSPYVVGAEGSGPATVGPGLTGDGTAGAPLTLSVSEWPYPCDIDTEGGRVYLDSAGVLRCEPRGRTTSFAIFDNQAFPSVVVPAATTTIVDRVLPITNPDPCRTAFVITNADMDVSFDLPAGSGASSGMGTDSMTYLPNTGTVLAENQHVQVSKERRFSIPPGGTVNEPFSVTVGAGSGGARYSRAQWSIRAYVWVV
ncbi:hypothetical protein [Streptomyces anulatus]|uniref:hypothetical protein n=1 Tax=Streptomyces anulatus TaxID=1892 RepID=UPI0036758250